MTTLPEDLKQIEAELKRRLPGTCCEWDPPENKGVHFFLDVTLYGKHVVVEIEPQRVYAVTLLTEDTLPFGGPDVVFQWNERDNMLTHVVGLFTAN